VHYAILAVIISPFYVDVSAYRTMLERSSHLAPSSPSTEYILNMTVPTYRTD
jgi:hypothetical protein